MITYLKQDITKAKHGVIVQQVNCQNKMGSGVARSLATKWPKIKEEYHQYCAGKTPEQLLGDIQTTILGESLFCCNVFGQLTYGRTGKHTNEGALLSALDIVFAHAKNSNLPVIIPENIGSGLGGGSKKIIIAGITELEEKYGTDIYLVSL